MKFTEQERLERHRKSTREWGRRNSEKKKAWLKANPEKNRIYQLTYQRKNREKRREWNRKAYRVRFFRELGITQDDYNKMLFQQEGRCWICSAEPATHKTSPDKLLIVDHDHNDGTIRGLLCQKCNKALGLFNDDLSLVVKAVHYLTKHAKEVAA